MRRLAFAVASFTLFAGTSALAQVGDIAYTAGSSYQTDGIACPSFPCTQTVPLGEGAGRFPDTVGATGGAIYNSFVTIGSDAVTFESSNAVSQGPFNSFTSSSEVEFGFNNPLGRPVEFHSEITPQGLGMYLANTSNGCLFNNQCDQVSDEDFQFSDLSALGDAHGGFLGGVAFQFEILDNESTVYSLSGSLFLYRGDAFCEGGGVCFIDGLGNADGGARSVLDGFEMDTVLNDFSARAFSWDSTDVLLHLNPGSHYIEYRTTVSSFTNADCLGATSSVCLVAFAGFGDPIGRGGAIDAFSAGFDVGALDHGDDDPITHLGFSPQSFALPVFQGGRLVFNTSGSVPEPGAWALMIMGFGFMGAALRRRRIPAHI